MANESPNVFSGDQFTAVALSHRVSRMPHQPKRIGELGLFETKGIRTTMVRITLEDGNLALIPYSKRGSRGNVMNPTKRKSVIFECGHFTLERTIEPSEIQNVMNPDETDLETNLLGIIDDKAGDMVPFHDATLEFQRLCAIKGYLLDSDGVTIVEDLYDRFKLTPKTINFALNNANTKVRIKCLDAKAMIERGLGGTTATVIRAVCGSQFFRDLISHPEVEKAFERYQVNGNQGAFLRDDPRYTGFEYGGIYWEEYNGTIDNVPFMEDEECQIFPVGVPGMFVTRFAPADMVDFVNTEGLPRYMSLEKLAHGRGYEALSESNPISLNCRPNATVKGTAS